MIEMSFEEIKTEFLLNATMSSTFGLEPNHANLLDWGRYLINKKEMS